MPLPNRKKKTLTVPVGPLLIYNKSIKVRNFNVILPPNESYFQSIRIRYCISIKQNVLTTQLTKK